MRWWRQFLGRGSWTQGKKETYLIKSVMLYILLCWREVSMDVYMVQQQISLRLVLEYQFGLFDAFLEWSKKIRQMGLLMCPIGGQIADVKEFSWSWKNAKNTIFSMNNLWSTSYALENRRYSGSLNWVISDVTLVLLSHIWRRKTWKVDCASVCPCLKEIGYHMILRMSTCLTSFISMRSGFTWQEKK